MTCNAKGNLRYRARTTTATIALVAGGYLVMSGTTAGPAAGQGSSEASKGGWLTQVWPGASRVDPAEDQADPQYVGANSKKKTTDTTTDPAARKRSKVDGKEDLFLPGPQYDKNYDAKGNVDIYGAKIAVEPPRPPLELGRQQYTSGQYDESSTLLGQLNPLLPGLAIYGDWRTAVAYNKQQRQGYCPDRDPAEHRRRLQDHRHRTNTRLLHAASEEQQIHPLRVRRRRRRQGGSTSSSTPTRRRCSSRVTSAPSIPASPAGTPVSTCPSLSVSSRCSCRTGSGRTTRSSAAR